MGLIFLGVGTLAAAVTQFAIQSTAGQQSTAALQSTITNWTEPLPGPMEGRASVIDGDTVEIAGQRIRFNGIDAPESRQYCDDAKGFEYPCGRRAAHALDKFLATSRPLHCSFVGRDPYGRLVGNCDRADGRSVQKWLVEQGYALDGLPIPTGRLRPSRLLRRRRIAAYGRAASISHGIGALPTLTTSKRSASNRPASASSAA
ncbi:thermonuclease family protein [Mesorhizobium sp.]|uniref:thermonuclease family protein n=1 Tax=Mesorhizobium sp. TaxID=1871066 RepID=UPI002579D8CB|nr:thermonuclease family protein [Mesorhizobium sp.]